MVSRVIRETHLQLIRLDELEDPLHELSASAMTFWPIVEIDDECGDVVKAMVDRLPPLYQPVHQAITRHFGGDWVETNSSSDPGIKMPTGVTIASGAKSWSEALTCARVLPPCEKGPTLTVALASIEIRNSCGAASAA